MQDTLQAAKALSVKYDMRVPRYTSYPTAPHFHDGITEESYRGWLGNLDTDTPLSLYFHIPFCDSMCWFCGCYTKIVQRYQPVKDYLDVMLKEIDLVADALPGRMKAAHMHWGGGSPTMLKGEDWMLIVDKLRDRFDVDDSSEIAVELDPRDATEDYVMALARAGVNRASIGVQDFHPEVQEAINRIQPFDITKRVVDWLRKHGIERINMDLIYGLPHQTLDRVLDMVDKTASLKPARVALFGYAHVPWMKTHQKMINEAALPDTEARWEQFHGASARLMDHGYLRIGFDHFAEKTDSIAKALEAGELHRNFQGYTADNNPVMLGFGASAIGVVPDGHLQNISPLRDYKRAIEDGKLPIARGVAFSAEDKLRSDVIMTLMCDMAVDVAAICKDHGVGLDHFASEFDSLKPLAGDDILTIDDGGKVTMTEVGRPFVRLAAAAFDTYLKPGEAKHSKAV